MFVSFPSSVTNLAPLAVNATQDDIKAISDHNTLQKIDFIGLAYRVALATGLWASLVAATADTIDGAIVVISMAICNIATLLAMLLLLFVCCA